MSCARAKFTLLVVIAAASTAHAEWTYKTTQDGQYKLGRNGPELSVELRTMTVFFRVPADCDVSACTDQPMNAIFGAGGSANRFSLSFTVEGRSHNYRSYLRFIRAHYDDDV